MSLSDLIKKGGLSSAMTMTLATAATDTSPLLPTVAKVATVTVAEPPVTALSLNEESTIRAWLAHICETNLEEINRAMEKCRHNLNARQYALEQAKTAPKLSTEKQLVRCGDCLHFKRIDHPSLGHCAKGEPEAPAGLLHTHQRFCDHFLSNSN